MNKQLRILIADDHQLLLDGISSLVSDEKEIVIAATATTGYEAVDRVESTEIDICLLDISMPGLDGIAAARIIKQRKPHIHIIMLTTYTDKEIVEELIDIGISGYMLKNCTRKELLEAFAKVCNGGLYFSPEVEAVLMQEQSWLRKPDRSQTPKIVITNRELEILELLSKEFTNEKIAAALNISYRTVETHRKNLMQKTKSHNLAGLLKYAYSNQLLNATDEW
jgi:DNA-binding NarL/FixJ family response regulator